MLKTTYYVPKTTYYAVVVLWAGDGAWHESDLGKTFHGDLIRDTIALTYADAERKGSDFLKRRVAIWKYEVWEFEV